MSDKEYSHRNRILKDIESQQHDTDKKTKDQEVLLYKDSIKYLKDAVQKLEKRVSELESKIR